MKGSNDLILNESTMMEAIQFWLNAEMVAPAPKVTGVKPESNSGYSQSFKVTLTSEEPITK